MEADMDVDKIQEVQPYKRNSRIFGQQYLESFNRNGPINSSKKDINNVAEISNPDQHANTKDEFLRSHRRSEDEVPDEWWDSQSTAYSRWTTKAPLSPERKLIKLKPFDYFDKNAYEKNNKNDDEPWEVNGECQDEHKDTRRTITKDKIAEFTARSLYYSPPCAAWEKIPSLIEAYIAVLMKTLLKVLIFSAFVALVWTLFWDVDKKLKSEESYFRQEAAKCEGQYYGNQWDGAILAPEAVPMCEKLYRWMHFNSDENTLYSKVAAGLIAEVLNDFFETISYNTIAKFVLVLAIFMILEIPYAQWKRFKMRRAKYVS